jgi:hypothetical protein
MVSECECAQEDAKAAKEAINFFFSNTGQQRNNKKSRGRRGGSNTYSEIEGECVCLYTWKRERSDCAADDSSILEMIFFFVRPRLCRGPRKGREEKGWALTQKKVSFCSLDFFLSILHASLSLSLFHTHTHTHTSSSTVPLLLNSKRPKESLWNNKLLATHPGGKLIQPTQESKLHPPLSHPRADHT